MIRGFAAVALVVVVGSIALVAQSAKPSGATMADAASKFLATLPADLRTKAAFAYDSPERTKWHFVPLQDQNRQSTRKGVRMEELNMDQKAAALALLRSGLSTKGYEQATTIMSLENILAELEPNGPNVRNPNWYFVSIFGEPSNTGKWGWRVEGHHLSVNVTVDRGVIVSTGPTVFATNPADVKDGPRKGLRVIGETEDLAKQLIAALTDDQKKTARQAKQFPEVDVKTRATVGEPVGLPAGKMTDTQKDLLMKLVGVYAGRMPGDAAETEMKKVKEAGWDKVYFGYCIEENKPGKPYTYRIHGPTFVVEFLNVQADSAKNPANHIHSAWRKLPADFGLDK
ncbi:MAG: DUF3500 domain-containing protein [Gemmataceae bacterium]